MDGLGGAIKGRDENPQHQVTDPWSWFLTQSLAAAAGFNPICNPTFDPDSCPTTTVPVPLRYSFWDPPVVHICTPAREHHLISRRFVGVSLYIQENLNHQAHVLLGASGRPPASTRGGGGDGRGGGDGLKGWSAQSYLLVK